MTVSEEQALKKEEEDDYDDDRIDEEAAEEREGLQENKKGGVSETDSTKAAEGDSGEDDASNEKESLLLEQGIHEEGIPETIFSLMFVGRPPSRAYFYALTLWVVQALITFAALADSFNEGSSNPANIPAGVPVAVTVTQGAIIPLAVASQNNFIEGVVRVNDRINEGIKFNPKSYSFLNWVLSSAAQMVVGLALLILVFLFTMQSESVFQVLVNIVALFAVANISTTGFMMARKGFAGYAVWKGTNKVVEHRVRRNFQSNKALQILYIGCVGVMFIAYGVVVHRQLTGYYACSSVFVQFDDTVQLNLPFLSGVYDRTGRRISGRFTYEDAITGETLYMRYCNAEQSWAIVPYENAYDSDNDEDPCSYSVLSQVTESFDVSTLNLPWRVQSERDDSVITTNSFLMQCVDCSSSSCLPQRGVCIDNHCQCKDGRYGVNCEFRAPCENLVVNANRERFPAIPSLVNEDDVVLPTNYILLKDDDGTPSLAYNRPVYYSNSAFADVYMLLFTGRRWAIISAPRRILETELSEDATENDIRDLLLTVFRNRNLYTILNRPWIQQFTVSEQVEIESPLDQGSPIGLRWIGTRILRSANKPVVALDPTVVYDAVFICAQCDDEMNKCENLGTCNNATGVCSCFNGTLGFPLHQGALCEKPLTCVDVQEQFPDILPTGCEGGYECNAAGTCDCLEEFPDAGRFCQSLPCFHESVRESISPSGCLNDGVCLNETGDCRCDVDLFEGKYCQNERPACNEDSARELYPPFGCSNNGVCNNITGFCTCDTDRFAGRYCQNELRSCDSDYILDLYSPGGCDHGGICNTTSGSCDCTGDIFQGKYCEETPFACDDPSVLIVYETGCTNNGTCDNSTGVCSCPEPFRGKYCEEVLPVQNETST